MGSINITSLQQVWMKKNTSLRSFTPAASIGQKYSCVSVLILLCLLATAWCYITTTQCHLLATCIQTSLRPTLDDRIGAYFQTSMSHMHATKLVFTLFRRIYAFAPCFLYDPITLMPYDATLHSASSYGTHFATTRACIAYMNRLKQAAQMLDWLLLLEDDVWVCNRIQTAALAYDMNGQCVAQYDVKIWGHITPGKCYGGYGGFVLRGSFLRQLNIDSAYIQSILNQIGRPIASDELISALFLRSNGTIGPMADYAERMTPMPVVVHQMKSFYYLETTCSI
jgi:hypothetical protein